MSEVFERLRDALSERYRLERELGRGGMATVFLAEDLRHHRPVAVKAMHPELASALGSDRFLREIEIAAHLTHPHILPLHDSGSAGGVLFYVMPYLAGESLRQRLEREKRLPLGDALQITSEVADALSYAHENGVIHRDIKPENVLLHSGHAYVADFGIARAVDAAASDRLTGTGIAIGTPAYMSPEQATAAGSIDGRADQYALGCMLYEMLAGEPPFRGPSAQAVLARHSVDAAPPLRLVRPEAPRAVEAAIARALAKLPSDRFATADEFRRALAGEPVAPPRRRWLVPAVVAVVVTVAAVLGLEIVAARRARPALDPNLVAVAPFEVLDPSLALWREGLMDVLSANLDGAGPLRTVPPAVIVRRWNGRADRASGAALGRETGARLALFGRLMSAGRDSLRLAATLLDVSSNQPVAEIELREDVARVDRAADSLTVGLLRELGRARSLGAVRSASLGSSSPAAIKAYLQGEQFYRRGSPDSAFDYFQRAVSLDTTFGLALRKAGRSRAQITGSTDSTAASYQWRAAAHRNGVPARESLLIVADSLEMSVRYGPESLKWVRSQRLMNTMAEAVRRYPDDPETAFEFGRALINPGLVSDDKAIEALERAITLDSTLAPAYVVTVGVAAGAGDSATARRYAEAGARLLPAGQTKEVMELLARLTDGRRRSNPGTLRMLDTAAINVLLATDYIMHGWVDTNETALWLERRLADPQRRASGRAPLDSASAAFTLAQTLAFHGHMREASRVAGSHIPSLVPDLAQSGAIPQDTADATFRAWLAARSPLVLLALPWWASRGDTAVLGEVIRQAGSPSGAKRSAFSPQVAPIAHAYLALVRGDTADALRELTTLGDSPHFCMWCYGARLTEVRLLRAAGRVAEAARPLEGRIRLYFLSSPIAGFWVLERARVNEQLGRRDQAVRAYRYVADLWIHADPEFQPYVAEARAALRRLGASRT